MKTNNCTPIIQKEDEFCGWLGAALPGDRCVYHRGFLAKDRDRSVSTLSLVEIAILNALAKRAMLASELDLVDLVQKKEAEGLYTYYAIARVPAK